MIRRQAMRAVTGSHRMGRLLLCFLLSVPWMGGAGAADTALAHAQRLLANTLLIDGHNDLPWAIRNAENAPSDLQAYDLRRPTPGATDLARLRQGGVGAQFWSVYVPGEGESGFAKTQLEQIELAHRMIQRYPEALGLARSADEIEAQYRAGRIASLLGMEGGHAIENSLGALRAYYALGVRYMTLTHNTHLDWADAAMQSPARHRGLTGFGREVVREMNRLGMIVDLSHASADTMHDALDATQAPVIFSHSNAYRLCRHPRNVRDDVLRRIPANGGIVMVTFVNAFVSDAVARRTLPAWRDFQRQAVGLDGQQREALRKRIWGRLELPPVHIGQVADHLDYLRRTIGEDHIGLGSDFDGNDTWPRGLSDVSMYPNLFAELVRRGWSDRQLRKLAGGNFLRALRQVEAVAQRLQADSSPGAAAGASH